MMPTKNVIARIGISISLCLVASLSYAQYENRIDEIGQTIQIDVNLRSFVGRPIWTLIIRDIDRNENLPYIFDFTNEYHHWVAFTRGRNYVITASRLQIEDYKFRTNKFKNYRLKNFCNLESNGRIMRGQSMYVSIQGNLSPNTNTYTCHITTFPEGNFYNYNQN